MLKNVAPSGSRAPAYTVSSRRVNGRTNTVRDSFSLPELEQRWEYYLSLACYDQSPKTLKGKRDLLTVLQRFLTYKGYERFDRLSITAFLGHVKNGHHEPEGRYGLGPTDARYYKENRPRTAQIYYNYLRAFCRFMVQDGWLDESPVEHIQRPSAPEPEVQPFTQDQVQRLLEAARRSHNPPRNIALLMLMYDAGLRAAEVCGLTYEALDLAGHYCVVRGKGNRRRVVRFGDATAQAILVYLRARRGEDEEPEPSAPLFPCDRSNGRTPLLPRGLRSLYRRLGSAAGLTAVRCSPHTMRHSYATSELEDGVNQKRVQAQMGHATPHMTLRYQHVVDTQLFRQEKQESPADRLLRKGRG